MICSTLFLSAQIPSNREYQIKAIFLFNFTQFVEWPTTSFSSDQEPLVIGILGKDPFGTYMKETIEGEKINGRQLIVQHYNNVAEIKTCHIVFINIEKANNLSEVILSLKGRNILTVGDSNGFLQHGGMVRFFTKNNKIQLQINPEAAKAANLIISSKLLRLAEIFVPNKHN